MEALILVLMVAGLLLWCNTIGARR